MKKIYLAAPFGEKGSERRANAEKAAAILTQIGDVYCPWYYQIPNAWDYPNNEWGLMVFMNDIYAIDHADVVVVLSYGRELTTAGTNWEAGYAFGRGKKVIVVEMTDEVMSLMVANGRYATLKGLEGLEEYDWDTMPPHRSWTEQK